MIAEFMCEDGANASWRDNGARRSRAHRGIPGCRVRFMSLPSGLFVAGQAAGFVQTGGGAGWKLLNGKGLGVRKIFCLVVIDKVRISRAGVL